jgi:hypothetical protein
MNIEQQDSNLPHQDINEEEDHLTTFEGTLNLQVATTTTLVEQDNVSGTAFERADSEYQSISSANVNKNVPTSPDGKTPLEQLSSGETKQQHRNLDDQFSKESFDDEEEDEEEEKGQEKEANIKQTHYDEKEIKRIHKEMEIKQDRRQDSDKSTKKNKDNESDTLLQKKITNYFGNKASFKVSSHNQIMHNLRKKQQLSVHDTKEERSPSKSEEKFLEMATDKKNFSNLCT